MTEKMTRRTVLSVLTAGLGAIWALAGAGLALVFVATPLRRTRAEREARLGPTSLAREEFRKVIAEVPIKDGWHERSEFLTVYVREAEDGSPYVLSATCTHLGCTVAWNQTKKEFACPCHAGHFTAEGHVISGPPPSALARLDAEVRDGYIYVKLNA